ncbi:hypothetical protein DFJ58DRAFT_747081 [Suillus subalutaceus]|uniref:uncharacterized protein n=1 Tax=Suillus subalutaceus TaxID=48586 RepID=UPI001B878C82|nr:uncharacterized protein DFJ58DRAFT_747081 [Suillus subalutaceus]KAG1847188.1 hypothetical protein DFJ58DRAFT_747081 [Suillus subalutaceus]
MGNRTRKQKRSRENLAIAWAHRESNKKQKTLNIEQDENSNGMATMFFGTPIAAFRNVANVTHRAFCEDVPDENDEDNMVAIRGSIKADAESDDEANAKINDEADAESDDEADAESDDEADGGTNGQVTTLS